MSFAFVNNNHNVEMSTDSDDTILSDIVMCLSVKKGTWFFDPDFGHELDTVDRFSEDVVPLVEAIVKRAVQKIIDSGKAVSIDVSAETSRIAENRIDYVVRAVQADGQIITWSSFKEII